MQPLCKEVVVSLLFVIIVAFNVYAECKSISDDPLNGDSLDQDEEIQNDDGVEYYIDENDKTGHDEDTITIDDEGIPVKISSRSQEFHIVENGSVIMPCTTPNKSANAAAVKIWSKGKEILFQSEARMAAAPKMHYLSQNGSLKISGVGIDDAGEYKCKALISGTNQDSVTHVLKVSIPPKIKQLYRANNATALRSGETLTLSCFASGDPTPTISWHKGDERLGHKGETLIVNNVKHRDAGTYRCLADNNVEPPAYDSIDVVVEHKPHVDIEKITDQSEDSIDVKLRCFVHATPHAQVFWRKDGDNLSNQIEAYHRGHIYSILIKNVTVSDFGNYTCHASNVHGETARSIELLGTPSVLDFIKPDKFVNDVILTWRVESLEPISLHELQYRQTGKHNWHFVNPDVSSTDNGTYIVRYTLKGLSPGKYESRIRSQNKHGWSEYSQTVPFGGDRISSTATSPASIPMIIWLTLGWLWKYNGNVPS